tara:strand:+ start:67 stop:390 length:324 start_codon:yes stop_codon:yes gene_type:complete
MIKQSRDKRNLEYFTINIKHGFTAEKIAMLALTYCSHDEKKVDEILKSNSYSNIIKIAKDQILDFGESTYQERFFDACEIGKVTEYDCEKLSQNLVDLSKGQLEWKS